VELARVSLLGDEINWTTPALHRGRLFLRDQSRAVCVYLGLATLLERRRGSSLLAAKDISRGSFRDLTPLLGIEPEFAFDVPGNQWLRDWYLAGSAVLAVAWLAAIFTSFGARTLRGRSLSTEATHRTFQAFAMLLGAAGTTVLSLWRNDFVFTWPVCLFVLYQALSDQVQPGNAGTGVNTSTAKTWLARIALLSFLAGCITYYLLCRQLSLVTEWAFLCGFAAAAPISYVRRWLARKIRRAGIMPLWQMIASTLEFSAYYWASVGVLLWRCRVA
jgi:hypothetical protein